MFEGAGQSCHESVRFGAKAYGNSDIVGYPRLVEMANQHLLLAKCGRQLAAAMGRVTRENKVCFRWQHLETEPRELLGHPIPFFHGHRTIALEMLLVLQGRDCTSLGRTAEWIGIEAVLDSDQRLNQPSITDRVADTQPGPGLSTSTWFGPPAGLDSQRLRM